MSVRRRRPFFEALATALALFALAEVNYPHLQPQSQLAIFAALGFVLCFHAYPLHPSLADRSWSRWADRLLALLSAVCCLYVVLQTEPVFEGLWLQGRPLGERAGGETALDLVVGSIGLLLVLEGARRSLGPALSILALTFVVYAYAGPHLPSWLFPHRGYDTARIVSQTFLQGQGVFGIALKVMFSYVYLFVVFGAFLELTGATGYLVASTRRLFSGSHGGPAKVAVVSSGVLGSLSGSAVANAAATGTFTIPLMRSAGFAPSAAAGVTAAASSGGALVPPVMGAGAYMMLEIIDPPVTYLEIVKAAVLPALLYYVSLLLLVHFEAKRLGAARDRGELPALPVDAEGEAAGPWAGVVFAASLGALMGLLLLGYTVFRAVSLALVVLLVVAAFRRETRVTLERTRTALVRAAGGGVPLITAAACVGIVIGIVVLTGIGTKLPGLILPLAEENLLLALFVIMVSSIVLGMGLPSAVCYLLLATLIGPVLGKLGVVPLAAHFFIFYFGMMSMVTPPVALAAYTAASIAGTGAMAASWSAFRYALVGFTLPYMFVFRPELLLVAPEGGLSVLRVAYALVAALLGITALAGALAGQLRHALDPAARAGCGIAAALLLYPGLLPWRPIPGVSLLDLAGALLLAGVAFLARSRDEAAGVRS